MLHRPGQTVVMSREGVRSLDAAAEREFGIPGIVLMENAAVALRQACLEAVREHGRERVVVCCGGGNNGGDGLATARHLANQGVDVVCLLATPGRPDRGDGAVNLAVVRRMGLSVLNWDASFEAGDPARLLIVDALLGTGATRVPEGAVAACIGWINALRGRGAFVLAVDLPSGLDADTGRPLGPEGLCVVADVTVTLAAMKLGMTKPGSARWCGEVLVGDIGAPTVLLRRFALGPGG